ncbi:trypsin alpha-like [Musca autumnalis]|uniref:trypsin alpha-like n=1 Tax=Musca autumnalis TaxID=221902 RepID=UPI003CE87CE1
MWFAPLGLLAIFIQYSSTTTIQIDKIELSLDNYETRNYNTSGVRIVGGKPINIRQAPWQVAVFRNGYFICGGSIISRDWILTAGHCVASGGEFAIRAASPFYDRDGQYRVAQIVVLNAEFNLNTFTSDIAMIRVRNSLKITQYARPISLAKRGRSLPQRLFISGWGSLEYDGPVVNRLRGVTLSRYNRSQCIRKYFEAGLLITNTMFCAGHSGRDVCQGDSGGPLVRDGIQYGIVSIGIRCSQQPSIFTNVRVMNQWIRQCVNRWGGDMPTFR